MQKFKFAVDGNTIDDDLLVAAYEQAVQLTNSDVAKFLATDTNKKEFLTEPNTSKMSEDESEDNTAYQVGDYVRATYNVDQIDYEAEIISIDADNINCVVRFIGYENEQTVALADLVDSWGDEEQCKQAWSAAADDNEDGCDQSEENARLPLQNDKSWKTSLPLPPKPPMPPMLMQSLGQESEHFSAMMMSWFMSGYYTGLYQGHKQAMEQQSKKSSKRK